MKPLGVLWAGLLAAMAGCIGPSVQSNAPHHVRDEAALRGPHVSAGTSFAIRLNAPLDTRGSTVGQGFSAQVVGALRGDAGEVIVPAGATVHGHIVSLGSIEVPRIRLQFDSIDTVSGAAAFEATVRHAERHHYPGPVEYRPAPMAGYFDSPYIYPFDYPYGWGVIGGGPWVYGYEAYRPEEVHVPAGGLLQLVLTRPLVLPGATIVR